MNEDKQFEIKLATIRLNNKLKKSIKDRNRFLMWIMKYIFRKP